MAIRHPVMTLRHDLYEHHSRAVRGPVKPEGRPRTKVTETGPSVSGSRPFGRAGRPGTARAADATTPTRSGRPVGVASGPSPPAFLCFQPSTAPEPVSVTTCPAEDGHQPLSPASKARVHSRHFPSTVVADTQPRRRSVRAGHTHFRVDSRRCLFPLHSLARWHSPCSPVTSISELSRPAAPPPERRIPPWRVFVSFREGGGVKDHPNRGRHIQFSTSDPHIYTKKAGR